MTKLRNSLAVYATICTVIVLALVVGAAIYGTSNLRLISHGPLPAPDDGSCGCNVLLAHGPLPAPDDGSCGCNIDAVLPAPMHRALGNVA